MRKLILQMQMSVDGLVSANHPCDWQLWGWSEENRWDDELKRDFNAFVATADTILLSRKMVQEGYLTHWGIAAKKYPAMPFYAFAQRIIDIEKVVLSDQLSESHWERTIIASGDLPKEVNALKAKSGGTIIAFGGAGFASSLLAADLIDELQLYINPSILGDGISIFRKVGFCNLHLRGSKAYDCGMIVSRYARYAAS